MNVIIGLLKLFLNLFYCIFKLFPTKEKIVFVSRQSDKPSADFFMLSERLKIKLSNYEIVTLTKTLGSGVLNKIKYSFHMIIQMYHIATSKIVILDSYCIVISLLKHKKNLKVIQMWHGIGTLKKTGYSILGKEEGRDINLAKSMQMHKNYDYILVSAKICVKDSMELFNYPRKNIKILPLPRVDILRDHKLLMEAKNKIYNKYPEMKKKENIVYAPTIRKDDILLEKAIYNLINAINYKKYNLIIKLHPLTDIIIKDKRVIFDKTFTTTQMLLLSDYVIADYSTIIFEAAILNKPLFFYTYDENDYVNKRDFYIDYHKEMPGIISGDAVKIMKAIALNKYNISKIDKFGKKYVELDDKISATDKITTFVISLLK